MLRPTPRLRALRPVGELGRGGSARVVEAVDVSGARVAVKLVAERAAADHRREQLALAALEGVAGVARLLAAGRCPAGRYLVLERVPGRSLQARVALGGPAPDLVGPVAVQLLAVLARIEAAGIVHGDVKPANVVLTPSGHPVLVDFGSSRRLGHPVAESGRCTPGTPEHLPPERLAGGPPTPAADRYGLGALLWVLATGGPPPLRADRAAAGLDLAPVLRTLLSRLLDPDPRRRGMMPAGARTR